MGLTLDEDGPAAPGWRWIESDHEARAYARAVGWRAARALKAAIDAELQKHPVKWS